MIRLFVILYFICYLGFFQIGVLWAWTYNPFKPKLPEWPGKKTVPHKKKKKIKPKKIRPILPNPIPSIKNEYHKKNKYYRKKKIGDKRSKQPVTRQKSLSPVPPLPRLEVTGVVWNSDRPQAIINNTVVGIGDIIENTKIKVVDIRKDAIDIIFAGKKITITP